MTPLATATAAAGVTLMLPWVWGLGRRLRFLQSAATTEEVGTRPCRRRGQGVAHNALPGIPRTGEWTFLQVGMRAFKERWGSDTAMSGRKELPMPKGNGDAQSEEDGCVTGRRDCGRSVLWLLALHSSSFLPARSGSCIGCQILCNSILPAF